MKKALLILIIFLSPVGDLSYASESEEGLSPVLKLESLFEIALKENHDILMAQSGIDILSYRIPQSAALPDPMVMIGYENEGWSGYTYGEMPGARWIFSASQMIPWPGKLSAKKLASHKEAESSRYIYEKTKLTVIEELKIKYHELFLAHKILEVTEEKIRLLENIEDMAGSRYRAGMAPFTDLIMAQTEKYMAMEQKVMQRRRIKALEAIINSLIGRKPSAPLGIPEEKITEKISFEEKEIFERAMASPPLREIEELIEAKRYKSKLAELEYYPDLTVSAEISLKPEPYEDMWMLSLSFNLPVFYRTRQRNMVLEARSELNEALHRLEALKQMIRAEIAETLSMIRASEELIELYKNLFIPKAEQAFEVALTAYRTGKIELPEVLRALNFLIDQKINYLRQRVEREKAIARLERLCGGKI